MGQNLAQKTYDVMTADAGRWLLDSHHDVRSAAVARAEEIIGDGGVEGVRVVSESRRTGQEEVVLEEMLEVLEKPLKIVPVSDAPVCSAIADFYAPPARLAAGRLLREYLDDKGRTALELAFDYGALRMLERNETLFPAAMRRIGAIHARKTGRKPHDCNDALYRFFEQIKNTARTAGDDEANQNLIKEGGLARLLNAVGTDNAQPEIGVLGVVAIALQKRGDWSDKLQLLIELSDGATDDQVNKYLDPIAAEILDSSSALTDLFGGFADAATALRSMVRLTKGRCQAQNPRSCLADFNELMARRPMPATSELLLSRVARTLGGVQPLTRENKEAEREVFKNILRDLNTNAGILGGADMASGLASRARIVFADHDDLGLEAALGHLMALFPYRAVRLGYLLDLICSPLGQENEQVILSVLAKIVNQLTSMSSLVPADMPDAQADKVIAELKMKMASEKLPQSWRDLFSKTLEKLSDQSAEAPVPKADTPLPEPEEPTVPTRKKIVRKSAKAGEVLFLEGEEGEEAYLIMDGEVEVFRQSGKDEVVLARLGRGDIIGEMSLIDNQPRMASARVIGDTKLTVINRNDLADRLSRLGKSDKVLRRLIDVFVNRLRGQTRLMD